MSARLVKDVVVNQRAPKSLPLLVLDGEPFPYDIDKKHGIKVEANDDNVHLVIVAIQVDRSVTIVDRSLEAQERQDRLLDEALGCEGESV